MIRDYDISVINSPSELSLRRIASDQEARELDFANRNTLDYYHDYQALLGRDHPLKTLGLSAVCLFGLFFLFYVVVDEAMRPSFGKLVTDFKMVTAYCCQLKSLLSVSPYLSNIVLCFAITFSTAFLVWSCLDALKRIFRRRKSERNLGHWFSVGNSIRTTLEKRMGEKVGEKSVTIQGNINHSNIGAIGGSSSMTIHMSQEAMEATINKVLSELSDKNGKVTSEMKDLSKRIIAALLVAGIG